MKGMQIALTGHAGFYNRGCEALVRSTSSMLRKEFGACEITLVSNDAAQDRLNPAAAGLKVVDNLVRRWSRQWFEWQVHKLRRQRLSPRDVLPRAVAPCIRNADVVLQIGGDNFTSDYGLHPGHSLITVNDIALENSVPLVFWGASIGPFNDPDTERVVLEQLKRAALVTVRESISEAYLAERGISSNVIRVADPAMTLEPSPVDLGDYWPESDRVFALNVSALSCRYRSDGDVDYGLKLAGAVIDEVLRHDEWGVLLVPHVMGTGNDDAEYMAALPESARVRRCPAHLDATEIKFVISQCAALMAARTHATIAAFSTGVPTISLAYSRKAIGINTDLFGHTDWVLDIVTMQEPREAVSAVRRLLDEREAVAAQLAASAEEIQRAADRGTAALARVLGGGTIEHGAAIVGEHA